MWTRSSYLTANESEILARARELEGRTVREVQRGAILIGPTHDAHDSVGHIVEDFFGIPHNNKPLPDFERAGVELKTVKMVRARNGRMLVCDERWTKITKIRIPELVRETWPPSSLMKKLHRVLFVYFERLPGRAKGDWVLQRPVLWSPEDEDLETIKDDWGQIHDGGGRPRPSYKFGG